MFAKVKRIGKIVVKESGAKTVWWISASVLPAANEWLNKTFGHSVTDLLPTWFPEPSWSWSIAIVALWIIFSLSRRIMTYETPSLDIRSYQSAIDDTWWVEVTNTGKRKLDSCVLNLERLDDAKGTRVFPESFGLVRSGNNTNPFPLRPDQPKQAKFASLKNEEIVLYLSGANRTLIEMSLEDEAYLATIAAYSEVETAPCKKQLRISRKGNLLNIS
jgi:hypothetical protein